MFRNFKHISNSNSSHRINKAQQKVEKALQKLDDYAIDGTVKETLWDCYRETKHRHDLLFMSTDSSKSSESVSLSGEISDDPDLTDTPRAEDRVLCEVIEDDGSLVWTITTPPDDPVPISLTFKVEASHDRDDASTLMMAGDKVVDTATQTALDHPSVLEDPGIQAYFDMSRDRLATQRRKMELCASNKLALDLASRLYFAEAFDFLRRAVLIVEVASLPPTSLTQ